MLEHTTTNIERSAVRLQQSAIVAIIRGDYGLESVLQIGETLLNATVDIVEVTLNTPGALDSIPELRRRFGGDMLVGAGTCRTASQVQAAIDAGADFIVSPNFDPASVTVSLANDILHLPGVATASEAQNAFVAGCKILKLFPCEAFGGASYLKALRAPLDDVQFVPTGGIGADNIADYARAGAFAVGVGSTLVSGANVTQEELSRRARALREGWNKGKQK